MSFKKLLYFSIVAIVGLAFGYILSKFCTQFILSKQTQLPQIGHSSVIDEQRQGNGFILQPSIPSPTPTPIPSTKILFGGDLMFDRTIRQRMEKSGTDFILAPLTQLFQQYDVVVANLEGPVTSSPSRSVNSTIGSTSNFIFTFDPNIIPMLQKNRFEIVNIGNNHIGNFGKSGIEQTKSFLTQGNIHFFGNTGLESQSNERVYLAQFNNRTFAFTNMNQFVDQGFEKGIEDIKAARPLAQRVIVMTHWGNEYQPTANQVIVNQAHQMIDAGADLIIGTHPHVIEQIEDYKGKRIYYSLGNFVFDQYFSAETMKGLLVGVEFAEDGTMKFTDIPVTLQTNGQTVLFKN